MKFPYAMLLDYVATDRSATEIGDVLTMAGFELEGIETVEDDQVLDIKVCSNRGDGLSVMGLAREVLAKLPTATPTDLYRRATRRFELPDAGVPCELDVRVTIETDACSRFAYRGFAGVRNEASPELIRKRLRQAGQRPISLFVDLTNYVMLELGQPLHAYDLKKLQGPKIVVRAARHGEHLTTLNGVAHELQPNQVMICDARGPIGVAGVMGGADTEVDSGTTHVLLEAAHFESGSVRKTRKELALSTDASYRFERSVDPEGVVGALNRVRELVEELGHSDWCLKGVTDVYPRRPTVARIRLRLSRAQTLLGMTITTGEAKTYLANLGFNVDESGDALMVTAPTWRPDIVREEDLVEELGRVHGYEKIPEELPVGSTVAGAGVRGRFLAESQLIDAALRAGFDQAMTHSLRSAGGLDDLCAGSIHVRTPGSADTDVLRNSLLPGLADAARRNGPGGIHLFELGPIFRPPYETHKALAFLSAGALYPPNRQKESVPSADFYSVKAALVEVFARTGVALCFEPCADDNRFHPGRSALVTGPGVQGRLGQIHPLSAERAEVSGDAILAEIVLDAIGEAADFRFKSVSRNPSVRRDVAFLIDRSIPFQSIENAIRLALPETLEDLWLFDVYGGQGVPAGQHSLGVALTLRKADTNFTDEEANQELERAVEALAGLGAKRR
ncbi:MAG: phenylalanine--tRNA ligase subunit beta [Fimbriimonadaceae bacterium]